MGSMKNSSQVVIALIVTSGFFFCVFFMLTREYPLANKDALNALLGVLTTIFTLIMNFFFGSSSGSVAKDETIGAIASAAPGTGTGGQAPVSIPDAKAVNIKTESGDVTVTKGEKP